MAKTRKTIKPRKPRAPRGPHDPFAVELIAELGGTKAVAEIFGIKEPSVSDWKVTGIPKPRLMYLEAVYSSAVRRVRKQNGDSLDRAAASDDTQVSGGSVDNEPQGKGGKPPRRTKGTKDR